MAVSDPYDYDTEAARIKRRRAEVAALRSTKAPKGEMVGRFYVAPSWAEQLAPVVNQLIGGYQERKLDEQDAALAQRQRAEAAEWSKGLLTPKAVELPGPTETGAPLMGERPLTRAEKFAHVQAGANNPLTRALAAKYGEDLLINEPIREEARVARTTERREAEAARAAEAEKARIEAGESAALRLREREAEKRAAAEARKQELADRAAQEERMARLVASLKPAPQGRESIEDAAKRAAAIARAEAEVKEAFGTGAGGKGGKGSAKEAEQRGKRTLELLAEAEPLIDASTGSYIGKGVDEVGRIFGAATPGSKAASSLGTIGGQLVAQMPRMEGPQSDKDVALYKDMAGRLDDPTIPAGNKRAALDTIRKLNAKYASVDGGASGDFGPAAPGAPRAPAGGRELVYNPKTGKLE